MREICGSVTSTIAPCSRGQSGGWGGWASGTRRRRTWRTQPALALVVDPDRRATSSAAGLLGALGVGGDLQDHPLAPDGVAVGTAHVLLTELVDVRTGGIATYLFDDPTPNLGVVVGVGGIEHGHRHAGVTLDVLVLLPADLGVDEHMVVVGVHPHQLGLGMAIAEEGGQGGEVLAGRQFFHCVVEHAPTVSGRQWQRNAPGPTF